MHSQRPNTMKETLHCTGILGQASYRYSFQNKFKRFPDAVIFYRVMAIFFSNNSSKIHSQRPKNTMNETLHCPVILGQASYR